MPAKMPTGAPWPLVSVVTPSYNQGQFIEETIRSVLLQGYPNLEYIVIDGGSTDESVDVIRRYEPWLAGWVSEPDNGQTHAINKGWQRAHGEALTWLNSDDTLLPHSLSTAVTHLFSEPGADLVYGDVCRTDAHSRQVRLQRGQPFNADRVIIQAHNPVSQQGFLMRRSLLDRVGLLDENLCFVMDYDFWLRVARAGARVRHIDTPLATFRQHPAAKTSTLYQTRIAERYRILENLFADPTLPARYRAQRQITQQAADRTAAYIAYQAGDAAQARAYAWRYIRNAKWRSSPLMLGLALIAWPGDQWMARAGGLFRAVRRWSRR